LTKKSAEDFHKKIETEKITKIRELKSIERKK